MNATFYVRDTTVRPSMVRHFPHYSELVLHLDKMCQSAFHQTRKQRSQLLEECGHGSDDYNSTLFVRSMQEQFEVGVIRDGRLTQCDVTVMVAYQKPEYGD